MGGNYRWAFPYIRSDISRAVEVGSRDLLDAVEIAKEFSCSVESFEPDPRAINLCRQNLEKSREVELRLFEFALGDTNNVRSFNVYTLGDSSLSKHKYQEASDIIQVEVRRFDSLGIQAPDLLVMDVQGNEGEVLAGFGEELKKVRYVIFESAASSIYENKMDFKELHQFLKRSGFKFCATSQSGKGLLKFKIMRLRNIFYSLRKSRFKDANKF